MPGGFGRPGCLFPCMRTFTTMLIDQKIPLGQYIAGFVEWLTQNGASTFDAIAVSLETMIHGVTFCADLVQPAGIDRPHRATGTLHPTQMGLDRFRHRLLSADPQLGVLAGNHGNPRPGVVRHPGVRADRRAVGHRRRAQTDVLHSDAAGARSDADRADLCVPHSYPDPLRSGCGPRV